MSHKVCPSWLGPLLLCPFRRLGQNPDKILGPYVNSGMTVLEIGPGMGFFTLPMARMAGADGRVVCVDVQERMLAAVRRRADKTDLSIRIETRTCKPNALEIGDLAGKVDFVLAFAVVHEVPDAPRLFGELAQAMKSGARCLIAEPGFHVSAREFDETLAAAARARLNVIERPHIRGSRAALLTRP